MLTHARLRESGCRSVCGPASRRPRAATLPVLAVDDQQLRAVGEELRRAAFVGLDVRQLVADDAVIRLAERRQRQGVGRRAVEDEEDFAIGLEQLAERIAGPLGERIVAIGGRVRALAARECVPGFGADAGVVVAGKLPAGGVGVVGSRSIASCSGCNPRVGAPQAERDASRRQRRPTSGIRRGRPRRRRRSCRRRSRSCRPARRRPRPACSRR